ncbi:UAP56-interacting factor-like [Rhinophrynus dorsalis]
MAEQQDQEVAQLHGDNEKIDMSLDDIIKLQNEQSETQSTLNQTSQSVEERNAKFRSRRYFRGTSVNQQGSNRNKLGFRQQGYSGVNLRNNRFGPVTRRQAASVKGVSPLNRQNSNQKSTPLSRPPSRQGQRQQQQQKRFRPADTTVQALTRSNAQNKRPKFSPAQRQQRSSTINQNRRLTKQITVNPGKRQPNARRWQIGEGFGSTLTVSVSNPKASQMKKSANPGIKRPGMRFNKQPAKIPNPLPKGVPLRFNFRAMANRTNVTLNERFSTLKIKGNFTAARRGGRTVMLA